MDILVSLPFLARILLAMALASAISYASTPFVMKLAVRIGAVDVPRDNRRMHKVPIPRLGGLAIVIAFLLCTFLFVKLDSQIQGVLLGAIIILVVGVLDDCLTLKAMPKFIAQIVAACLVYRSGCEIRYVTNPFSVQPIDLGFFSGFVTVVWIVMMTNAVNFIDGLDGLAVGVSGISTGTMLVIAMLLGEESVAVILAALLGACLGFIPFNFNPARIFMGDTGSTFLGFVLASMSVQGLFKMYAVISFVVLFLILGVSFFDITFAVIRRLAKHQNPMTADRGHIHHRLIDMGLNQKQSVAIVYMLTGVLGLAAVLLANSTGTKAFILFSAVCVVAIVGFAVIFGPTADPPSRRIRRKVNKQKAREQRAFFLTKIGSILRFPLAQWMLYGI